MIVHPDCALNGVPLSAVDHTIVVTDVQELPARQDEIAFRPAGRSGAFLQHRYRRSLEIRVLFQIREYDLARRKAICTQVAQWAEKGGFLTLGDRPGQRLRVVCPDSPVLPSSLKWTQPLSLSFVSQGAPFWESEQPARVTVSAAAPGTLRPGGCSLPVPVDVQATNLTGSTVSEVTFTCGDTFIALTGLSWPSGAALEIGHEAGRLFIRQSGESILHARTPRSSDDLLIPGGQASEVQIDCAQAVSATFCARGVWL